MSARFETGFICLSVGWSQGANGDGPPVDPLAPLIGKGQPSRSSHRAPMPIRTYLAMQVARSADCVVTHLYQQDSAVRIAILCGAGF